MGHVHDIERAKKSVQGRRMVVSLVMALLLWPAALFLELALLMREKFIGPENPAVTETVDPLKPLEDARGNPSARAPVEAHDE